MADIRCPICPEDIECEHDQDERRILWAEKGQEPELEPAAAYNAADPKQVSRKASKEKAERERADNDLRGLMASEAGRRIVWRLLEKCNIFRLSFNPSLSELGVTAFNEGKRQVGLELLSDVQRVAEGEYLLMLKERIGTDAS